MKKLFLFLLFLIPYFGFSQEQPKEEKKSYVDPISRKVYWNKSLPIMITLSSPYIKTVNLDKTFYLDTEGVNYLRTKWEMDSTGKYITPLREQQWEIYADSKPPKTTITFIAKSTYIFKGKKYYSDDLKVELTSKDELSGVAKIYYSINDQNFKLYENLVKFEAGLDIDFKFYSVDNVGNVEKVETLSYDYDNNALKFGIDNVAPETSIAVKDSILSPKDVIFLTSTDFEGVGVNSIYYKFDSLNFNKYLSTVKLDMLNDGYHIFTYLAQDWINNKEDEKIFSFYLDAKAPEIQIIEEIINDELTNLRRIVLTATDNKSGVDKILVQLRDDAKFEEYTKPFYVDITHQQIKIKAIDKVGNESVRIVKYNEIR